MRKLKLEELGRLSVDAFKNIPKFPLVVVLDNIRSAMNVGSVFRTCDAFKIQTLYLCGITAKPPHREILKTAIGANHSVHWQYADKVHDLLLGLRSDGFKIIGIEQTDQSIGLHEMSVAPHEKYVLVFGNEVHGLSDEILPLLDVAVEVPQFGTKHSMNVSVCAGIVLWEFVRSYLDQVE